jgi:anti-sigma factor RsiW
VSARPFVPRLADEELDLLISRSLDGDLSPEEASGLEAVLAHDPAAARRKEELASIVAEARALPAPAPPFALATRVSSNVSEKTARGGSVFHRFGFYPPPGAAIGAMVVLGFVAVAITVLKPVPPRAARRVEGPVDVFFTEGAKSGAKDQDNGAVKRTLPDAAKIASKETAKKQAGAAQPARASEPSGSPASAIAAMPVESVIASNEPAFEEKQRKKLAKAEVEADTPVSRAVALAPAPAAPVPQAAGAVAPRASGAPRDLVASGARANALNARTWSVLVRGGGARRWMLRSAPEGRPSAASSQASAFRVTLDADGRVTSVRALDARPVQPALLEFVRGLVFTPVGTPGGAVAEGIVRDERAKAERADALADRPAENTSEIDVEVSTR